MKTRMGPAKLVGVESLTVGNLRSRHSMRTCVFELTHENTERTNIGKYGVNPGYNGLLDEVKIYNRVLSASEITAEYQNLGTFGTTLESSNLKLTVNSTGQITEFKDKPTGISYNGGTVDLMTIIDNTGAPHSPVSCLQKDGKLLLDFGSANVGAEITTKLNDSYFVLQTCYIYGNTANVQFLKLLNLNPSLNTYVSDMSGIKGDDTYTVALRAMNPRSDVTTGNVFPGLAYSKYGLELAKFGLLGCPAGNIRTSLQTMVTNERLARTSQGGPWALDVAANTQSYIIVYNLSPSNVNSYITLANEAGSKIIDCEYWWNSTGHYVLNTDLKTCVTAIHAAGLKASLHTLTCVISTNDSYVTPSADTRLQKDAQFTLTSINATTISATSQLSTGGLNTTGQVLQIDNELITYTGYTITGSAPLYTYTFSGCTRGAYSTTVKTHATGASIGHLRMYGNCFFPDPNSNLVNEIADRIAYVFNDCNFDMIYLDAADFSGSTYAGAKWGTAIINRIGKPVRVEASSWAHQYWPFYSNIGAWDTPEYGTKTSIDSHAAAVSSYSKTLLLPCQLGWWCVRGGPSTSIYAQFPDEVELLCARSLGCDAALSFIILIITEVARQDEYFQMVHGYETLRAAGSVPESVKSQLKTPGLEFHLTTANSIIRQDIPKQNITSLSDGSNTWTVNNQFGSQSAKFRILALHSELTAAYDNGPSVLVTDFSGLPGEYTLTQATNVTSSMTYVPGTGCTYTATNNGTSSSGAWTKASKSFSPALDISGDGYYNDTIGVWVNGDGKGEILNFQYCQPEYDDHYVTVDFTGWKYFELFLRERDADDYYNYVWPYGSPGCYPLHYYVVPRTNIPIFNIYYNNIPPGQTVSCQIKPVKALFTQSIGITNASISINGTQITFPVTLQSGEYLEFNSMTDCKHYDGHGTFLGYVTPAGSVPTLNSGNNTVVFSGSGTSGYNTRANVTMFIDGPQIYPYP